MAAVDLDTSIRQVAENKEAWASLSPKEKLAIIDVLMDRLKVFSEELHEASMEKRDEPEDVTLERAGINEKDDKAPKEGGFSHLDPKTRQAVETASAAAHWMHSSMLVGIWLSVIREYFEAIVRTGKPPAPFSVRPATPRGGENGENEDHQYFVKVGPKGLLFTTMLTLGSMELLVESESAEIQQDLLHERTPQVVAVLGAGNFDAPIDVLTALFIENSVCIYKSSPFNHRVGPVLEQIFQPLIDRHFLLFVEGDVEQGSKMLHHECVTKWYMTGSIETANRILWGSPTPPPAPSSSSDVSPAKPVLKLDKPFTTELGSCTPWIICPGKWSRRELEWHASNLAAALLYNGAHICVHPQLLVTCKNWEQREEFLSLLKKYQRDALYIGCYYPDYATRLRNARTKLMELGRKAEDFEIPVSVPLSGRFPHEEAKCVILATDLPEDNFIAVEEMFCPVCGEVPLDTPPTVADFLPVAVNYVNEKVRGTLSTSVSVKTNGIKDEQAVDDAILNLRYGSVHVNTVTMLAIAFPSLVWGGHPGATIYNLQSGMGFFGNCYGFAKPVKSVVRAPFLNFTQILIAPSNKHNVRKMAKLWRRIVTAVIDRRTTQGWFSFTGQITKIVSALVANL